MNANGSGKRRVFNGGNGVQPANRLSWGVSWPLADNRSGPSAQSACSLVPAASRPRKRWIKFLLAIQFCKLVFCKYR